MIISAIVIVAYTTLGGFLAASTTDFIQSIIMSIALVIVFIFGIQTAGGWDAVVDNASSLPGYLTMTTTYNPVSGMEEPYPLHQYLFHDRMGTWIFWYASYSSSFHGHRR